jgi:hypothetical protein
MHQIEPYHGWLKYYNPSEDSRSPFSGKTYNFDQYSDTIYGYYIDPAWDYIGSETLYIKILFSDYEERFSIIQFIGEWNDAINNDIMQLKREVIDILSNEGIGKFLLVGENIFNFHGSDDSYYEEWFDDIEDGWIAALEWPDFIQDEMRKYHIDRYINMGEALNIPNWRTLHPQALCELVDKLIRQRIA